MCPIVLLLLVLLTAGASAIEKNIAHPAPTETSIVSDAVLDKIIASPLSSPSSYPEEEKVQEMMQEYTTLMTDFDAASHNHVEHTSKILDVAEITQETLNKYEEKKLTLAKRMLVTLLEKDKQAKKTVFNAADESPTEAPVSAPGNQPSLSSRRLKLESQQVFDYSGASDIYVRKTVKQIRKTHFWWKISHKRKIPLFSKISFSFPSHS